jgi:hypothetical protein
VARSEGFVSRGKALEAGCCPFWGLWGTSGSGSRCETREHEAAGALLGSFWAERSGYIDYICIGEEGRRLWIMGSAIVNLWRHWRAVVGLLVLTVVATMGGDGRDGRDGRGVVRFVFVTLRDVVRLV